MLHDTDTWGSQPIPRERRKKSTGYKIAKIHLFRLSKTEKSDFALRILSHFAVVLP